MFLIPPSLPPAFPARARWFARTPAGSPQTVPKKDLGSKSTLEPDVAPTGTGGQQHVDQMLTNVDIPKRRDFRRVATKPEGRSGGPLAGAGKRREMLTKVDHPSASSR